MARHWLLKSEPDAYAFHDLERDGKTVWDGVSNNLALKHMRQVKPGDEAFFYHTGKQRAIVGVARVDSDPYPDPERDSDRLVVFDVRPVRRLPKPVTLSSLKEIDEFSEWELIRNPRLSVMPVPEAIWSRVLEISGA